MRESLSCDNVQPLHLQMLLNAKFIKDLEPQLQERVSSIVQYLSLDKGEVIFRQGDSPANCYLLLQGSVAIHVEAEGEAAASPGSALLVSPKSENLHPSGLSRSRSQSFLGRPERLSTVEGFSTYDVRTNFGQQVGTLGAGSIFGELALTNDQPRSATIVVTDASEFLVIPRRSFDLLLKSAANSYEEEKHRFLSKHVPGLVDPSSSQSLFPIFQKYTYSQGKQLLLQGEDSADLAYVLISGSITVAAAGQQAGILKSGDFFGSIRMVVPDPFTLTVSSPKCEVYCVMAMGLAKFPREIVSAMSDALELSTTRFLETMRTQEARRRDSSPSRRTRRTFSMPSLDVSSRSPSKTETANVLAFLRDMPTPLRSSQSRSSKVGTTPPPTAGLVSRSRPQSGRKGYDHSQRQGGRVRPQVCAFAGELAMRQGNTSSQDVRLPNTSLGKSHSCSGSIGTNAFVPRKQSK